MSNEHPIMFKGWGVGAIMRGEKTQTRRAIRFQATAGYDPGRCPYGQPGDVMWVREKMWRSDNGIALFRHDGKAAMVGSDRIDEASFRPFPMVWHWKRDTLPAMYMPRSVCRLLLRVKAVRVERLCSISADDARVDVPGYMDHLSADEMDEASRLCRAMDPASTSPRDAVAIGCFAALWNGINRKRGFGWDTNPWVWVVEFELVRE